MDPREAGKGFEPNPIPNDLPRNAPILNDIERGYSPDDEKSRAALGSDGEGTKFRKGSVATLSGNEGGDNARKGSVATLGKEKEKKEKGSGLTEGDHLVDALPENNLFIVMPCIALVLFLGALDQTIVATALPTIAEELNASPSEYSWVGTAYQLAMTLMTPINGRVSDIIGRKPMLYAAIICFFISSALCGAAKGMTWLIVARAFQGLGGGSIIGLTTIVTSDIVPLHKRGTYQGFLGGAWGIAAVLGPILGGLLTERASWRWCFYINLPTCGISLVLLFFKLNLNPTKKYTFAKLRATFDFLGLFLVMIAGALLIVGFSIAADDGFDKPSAIAVIVVGFVAFVGAIINCLYTKRNAIIPARMFKLRTTLFFLIGSTLQATAFIPSNYLLPQLFQGVRGSSALGSGIELLPFACCVAWMTVVAGQINSRLRIVRPVAWVGYALSALGYGLLYHFFTYGQAYSVQEGLLVIPGIGVGLSLQTPLLVLQAAMPLKEMAAATSAWTLTRSLGGSIGIAVFTAVLNTGLRSRFALIEGYGTDFDVPTSTSGYAKLQALPDGPTKDAVLTAFADSLRVCWIIDCALFILALVLTLWTRSYSQKRATGPAAAPPPDESLSHPTSGDAAASSSMETEQIAGEGSRTIEKSESETESRDTLVGSTEKSDGSVPALPVSSTRV